MNQFSHHSDRQPWKSREPQPIVLPEPGTRYTSSQIRAASSTTVVDHYSGHRRLCGGCGQASEPDGRFCGHCGTQLV